MSDYRGYTRPLPRSGSIPPAAGTPDPQRATRVCIVTDSASDILPSHARAMGLIVVPSRIVLDGAVYRVGIDLTASQFYARLPRLHTPPFTEPAAPQEFSAAYRAAFRQGATAITANPVAGLLSKIMQHALVSP